METIIVIGSILVIYILSIFLTRWLNKLICKMDGIEEPEVLLWFIPIFGLSFYMIGCVVVFFQNIKFNKSKSTTINWFIGNNWENK